VFSSSLIVLNMMIINLMLEKGLNTCHWFPQLMIMISMKKQQQHQKHEGELKRNETVGTCVKI
jgi:hypothetical protein